MRSLSFWKLTTELAKSICSAVFTNLFPFQSPLLAQYEGRTCYICKEIGLLEGREKWSGLARIGVIFCKVEQAGKVSRQAHYFVFSRNHITAAQVLDKKRSHLGSENQLHWVLDMQFREDESRARSDNSAENLNVLCHWAYNLLKSETSEWGSFSDKQFRCLLDDTFLDKIVYPFKYPETWKIIVDKTERIGYNNVEFIVSFKCLC